MLNVAGRTAYDQDHKQFRDSVRKFLAREYGPNLPRWEENGIVDRSFWLACGAMGLLCPTVSEEFGGPGLDFRYNAIIDEELGYYGSLQGTTLQSDITAGYIA